MANPSYMSIKGVAQRLICTNCSIPESIGKKHQPAPTDETSTMPQVVLQNGAEPKEQEAICYREMTWIHPLARTSGHTVWGEEG